jgi:hypothetical protein
VVGLEDEHVQAFLLGAEDAGGRAAIHAGHGPRPGERQRVEAHEVARVADLLLELARVTDAQAQVHALVRRALECRRRDPVVVRGGRRGENERRRGAASSSSARQALVVS